MIATDPLSLLFLACILFSGGFLAISTVLGGQSHAAHVHLDGHGLHLGAHADAGHGIHLHAGHGTDAGHAGHVGHAADAGHASGANASNTAAGANSATVAPWQAFSETLASGLNLYSVLMFLLAFGLVGYLLHNFTHIGTIFSLLVAIVLGAGSGIALGNLLFRLFLPGAETELSADSSRLEGRLGQVNMPIREGGIGEVLFARPGGGRQSIGARSANGMPIAAGTEVVILSYEDGIATVQAWDGFMLDVRQGREPLLQPLDLP